MKTCKHCGEPGYFDKLGREYSLCVKCLSDRMIGKNNPIHNIDNSGKNNPMYGGTSPMKGKRHKKSSIEKMRKSHLGKKLSDEHKLKLSKAFSGKNNPMYGVISPMKGKKRIFTKETRMKMSIAQRNKKPITEETRMKMRISQIKHIEETGGNYCSIGKNETQILDNIEQQHNIKITRQYPVIGYFLDGYDEQNNVVYEVDEKHHLKQKIKDEQRKNNIIRELQCDFVIVEDY